MTRHYTLLAFMLAPILAWLAAHSTSLAATATQTLPERLTAIASMFNTQWPKMVDSETRAEEVLATDSSITLRYTMVNTAASEADPAQIKKQLHSRVTTYACTNRVMNDVLNEGGRIGFRYDGKNRVEVITLWVSKHDCKDDN